MTRTILGLLGAVLPILACATDGSSREGGTVDGVIRIDAKSGSPLTGEGTLRKEGKRVELNLRVAQAPPGKHAVHLHEKGDCSAPDAESAGDHWNPMGAPHGHLENPPAHLGDIGNLMVDVDGKGTLNFSTEQWTIGTGEWNDVVSKSLVIHAEGDDFRTQPSGGAGARIGCGVVEIVAPPVAAR